VASITEIDQLRIENSALRDENERLANENARLGAVRVENDQLTALLQLQSGFDHETVATRVIGRESLESRRLVILDKGTDDGIAEGDAVVVQGGALVGRVTDVGPSFAKVTLISDSSSTVVGQLLGSGATGEVVGQAGGVLVMRNIDSSVPIGLDEEVFTAGIELAGGIRSPYPRGLLVGTVVDVQRDANDVVQTAFLAPAGNLDAFELALVITDYEGGLPPVDQQPVPCGTEGTIPEGEVPCYTPSPAPRPTATPRP
jgi:rod shape-determining protein MreC